MYNNYMASHLLLFIITATILMKFFSIEVVLC